MDHSHNVGGIHGAIQLADGGELTYIPGFFPAPVADEIFAELRDGIAWEQMTIRGHQERRRTKWFGEFDFSYSGVTRPAVSWEKAPQAVQSIRFAVEYEVFGTSNGQFNGVLLNYYRNGDDQIGLHADNEKDILRDSPIASVSFGAERRFILKHNDTSARHEITLTHGSLLVMAGTLQRFWKHCVPVERRIREGRINLTFRMYSRRSASESACAYYSLGRTLPCPLTTEGHMAEVREVDIVMIQMDPEIQPRERLLQRHLHALIQLLQEDGAEAVPPVVLFRDADGVHWLADGHYRVTAALKALENGGPRMLLAEVHEGTKRDAIYFAAGANKHGTKLTIKEKRRAVIRLLQDDQRRDMSDNAIARHIGISNSFVSRIHNELRELDSPEGSLLEAKIPQPRTTTYMRGGKKITQRIGNIGRGKNAKAKTPTTPTPPPTSPEEQIIDEGKEHTTNDDREVVEAVNATDLNALPDESASANDNAVIAIDQDDRRAVDDSDDDRWPDPPKGFVDLIAAWFRATADGRNTFLTWANPRKIDEPAGKTTPEQHARFYLVGLESLKDMSQAFEAIRQQHD
jgi:alkylated DNA repair dioxygenase AlkB